MSNFPVLTAKDEICVALRRVQKKTGCSTKTLNLVHEALRPYLRAQFDGPLKVSHATKKIAGRSGAVILRLHGCVGCHEHVFMPKCRARLCPKCQSPRYQANGKPKEVSMVSWVPTVHGVIPCTRENPRRLPCARGTHNIPHSYRSVGISR